MTLEKLKYIYINLIYKEKSLLIKEKCFTLHHGGQSHIYLNHSQFLSQYKNLNLLANIYKLLLPTRLKNFQLGAVDSIMSPVICGLLSRKIKKDIVIIKKRKLEHGLENKIYGNPKGQIVLIDDVTSTGSTLVNAAKTLRKKNTKVKYAIVSACRNQDAINSLSKENIKCFYVSTYEEILKTLWSNLTNKEKRIILKEVKEKKYNWKLKEKIKFDKKIAQKTANLLLDIKAVSIKPHKPFKFTSGIYSPIYIDNRLIMSYTKERNKIIDYYTQILKEKVGQHNVNLISGTATAAIPYATLIADKLNLPMVYVRPKKKGHGKKNQIEGVINKNQKVVVIEDHVSTGGSLVENVQAIRKAKAKVKYAIATTTFLLKTAKDNFKKAKIKIITLTNIKHILNAAITKKIIKKEDKNLVMAWTKDPKGWAKKHGHE